MSSVRFLGVLAVLAAAVFTGVWWVLRGQEAAVRAAAGGAIVPAGAENPATEGPRSIAEIQQSLRALKLVTVELKTTVQSLRLDQSWRGDVRASVAAPVTLYFGCDLSGLGDPAGRFAVGSDDAGGWGDGGASFIRPNLLTGGYTLRVPRPTRIAVEVEGDREQTDVEVGWGRFRDLGGEFQLGLARSGLHAQARRLILSIDQQRRVEDTTRQQLTTLVRALAAAGGPVPVHVEFFDTEASSGPIVNPQGAGDLP